MMANPHHDDHLTRGLKIHRDVYTHCDLYDRMPATPKMEYVAYADMREPGEPLSAHHWHFNALI